MFFLFKAMISVVLAILMVKILQESVNARGRCLLDWWLLSNEGGADMELRSEDLPCSRLDLRTNILLLIAGPLTQILLGMVLVSFSLLGTGYDPLSAALMGPILVLFLVLIFAAGFTKLVYLPFSTESWPSWGSITDYGTQCANQLSSVPDPHVTLSELIMWFLFCIGAAFIFNGLLSFTLKKELAGGKMLDLALEGHAWSERSKHLAHTLLSAICYLSLIGGVICLFGMPLN